MMHLHCDDAKNHVPDSICKVSLSTSIFTIYIGKKTNRFVKNVI